MIKVKSTPESDFPQLPTNFVLWLKKIFVLKIGPKLMDEFRSKQWSSSRKWEANSTLQQAMSHGVRKTEEVQAENFLLPYFTRWVKYCIDQQRVRVKCYMLSVSVACVFLTNDSSRCSRSWSVKTVIRKCYKKKFWIRIRYQDGDLDHFHSAFFKSTCNQIDQIFSPYVFPNFNLGTFRPPEHFPIFLYFLFILCFHTVKS